MITDNNFQTKYKCPYCGSTNTEYDSTMILTSNPPQNKCRCKDCGEHFFSGQCRTEWTNRDALDDMWKHNQSILNTPKIEDPLPGESPYWTPLTPDPFKLNPPYKQSNYGWICPKCGRVMAPFVDSCKFCGSGTVATPVTIMNPDTFDLNDYLSKSINDSNRIVAIPNPNNKLTNDSDLLNYITITNSEMNETNKATIAISSVNSNRAENPLNPEIMQKFLNESESVFEAVDKYQEWEKNNKNGNN